MARRAVLRAEVDRLALAVLVRDVGVGLATRLVVSVLGRGPLFCLLGIVSCSLQYEYCSFELLASSTAEPVKCPEC